QRRHSALLAQAAGSGQAPETPRPLTPDQRAAVAQVRANQAVLLHGVTGSGKTEVYLAAAEAARVDGLQSLVLVPEISLTPQLVERFARRFGGPRRGPPPPRRFGGRLAVLHSRLTELERAQQWWRARRGEVDLVIGSRSA